MLHHKGCKLAIEVVEEDHIAVAHLIQYRDKVTFSIGSSFRSLHDRDVRDEAVVTDCIVINIIPHLLNQAVVTNGHIA